MAQRKKPETSPQLDASAVVEPEDRKNRPRKASKPGEVSRSPRSSTQRKIRGRIAAAAAKVQADNEFESTTGIRINVGALKGLCLRGPRERREELLRHVKRTLDRLGVSPASAQPFGEGKGSDNYPPIHDLLRWLDAIRPGDAGDLELLQRCGVTLTK